MQINVYEALVGYTSHTLDDSDLPEDYIVRTFGSDYHLYSFFIWESRHILF